MRAAEARAAGKLAGHVRDLLNLERALFTARPEQPLRSPTQIIAV